MARRTSRPPHQNPGERVVFDSVTFLVFFAVFFGAHHLLHRSVRAQNILILAGSCVFYGWWDVRFLALLFVSAGIDYVAGLRLAAAETPAGRRRVLLVSMISNLGILFVFKYFDFFASSLAAALAGIGVHATVPLLRIALPVGISFYTFQSMSYTIDIYRGEIEPERNPVTYFAFVSFFPHMVAGPIQRAQHLLGQLNRPRVLTRRGVEEGVWLLLYGYFLKEAIANPAAAFADQAFFTEQRSGWSVILGTLAFSIQIYCDFWAYSMIARGAGRLLGIEFIWNFNQPYFATSMQDFWRRWHISLSTWLRDYLYIPLGGSRKGRARTYVNLVLTMLLGGLWHGAAWNFVFWGLLHGVAQAGQRGYEEALGPDRRRLPAALRWAITMGIVVFGWFLFRCRSWEMITGMLSALSDLAWTPRHTRVAVRLAALTLPLLAIELWQYRTKDLLAPLRLGRWSYAVLGGAMLAVTVVLFNRLEYAFIYFQF